MGSYQNTNRVFWILSHSKKSIQNISKITKYSKKSVQLYSSVEKLLFHCLLPNYNKKLINILKQYMYELVTNKVIDTENEELEMYIRGIDFYHNKL